MKKNRGNAKKFANLRRNAEEAIKNNPAGRQKLQVNNTSEVIHELQVHQIELEMQNEELRKAQVQLEEYRSRYCDLYDFAPVGYFCFDSMGLILEVNLTGAALLGAEKNDLINKPFSLYVSKKDGDLFYLHRRKSIETNAKQTCEIELVRKDGSRLYALLETMAIENSQENSGRLRTTVTDITERKRADESLRRSEVKFRTLYDSTSEAVMLFDGEGFFDCNKATLALFGCADIEEFCSKHPADLSPPQQPCGTDSLTLANQHIATAIEKGSARFEWVHKQAYTGKTFPAEVLLNAMELDGKRVLQAVVHDITERKQVESELTSLAKFPAENPNPVLRISKDGDILFSNDAGMQLLSHWKSEVGDKVPEKWKNLAAAALEAGKSIEEIEEIEEDEKTFSIAIAPVKDTGYINFYAQNITERTRAEEERSRLTAIIEESPDFIGIADMQGNVLYQNRAANKMVGLPEDADFTGQNIRDMHPDWAAKLVAEEGVPIALNEGTWHSENSILHRDGREIPVSQVLVVHRGSSGEPKFLSTIMRDITDRKQTEEKLRASEEQYRSVVDNIGIGVAMIGPNMEVLTLNKQMQSWFPDVDVSCRPFCHSVFNDPPKETPCSYCPTILTLRDGQIHEAITETPAGDKVINFRVISSPIKNEDGKVIAAIETVEDVTERKRIEDVLKQSEETLKQILDSISFGVMVVGKDKKIRSANRVAMEMAGYASVEEMKGVVCHQNLCPAETGKCPILDMHQTVDKSERVLLNNEGKAIPVLKSAVPIVLNGEEVLLESFVDIATLKKAEEKIKTSEAKYRKLFEGAMDAIFWADVETGILLDCNEAAARLMQKPKSEIIGQHQRTLHPETGIDEALSDEFKKSIAGGENTIQEAQVLRKDGQVRDVVIKTNTIENDGRKILQGIFVDITADKQAKALLRLAKEEADSANEAKSQFLANMSHELRTPMNSIIGFADLLTDEELTDDQQDYLNMIQSNSQYLLQLLADILDFSKIEAHKLDLEMLECSPETILSKVKSLTVLKAEEKCLKFKINRCQDMPTHILTDPTRLTQCLVNLASNAIKFTERGHVYINVSSEDRDGREYVRFDVEDTGIGIADDKQDKIFEAFTQEDGSMTRKFGGTGLGLTITRKLVELLGGQLTVSSQVGKGSVFSFALPVQPLQSNPELNQETECVPVMAAAEIEQR